jgi:uncharacterized protein YkwD
VHNSERSAVGVKPLVWSDNLATESYVWAKYLATSGAWYHDEKRGNVG